MWQPARRPRGNKLKHPAQSQNSLKRAIHSVRLSVLWLSDAGFNRWLVLCLLITVACRPITAIPPPKFIAETRLLEQSGYGYLWSPDGKWSLLSLPKPPTLFPYQPVDQPLAILELATGHTFYLPKPGHSPLWSPDGSAILFSSGDLTDGTYQLWLYGMTTGDLVEVSPLPGIAQWWLDNGRLAYEAADGLWFTTLTLPVTVDPALGAVRLSSPQSWFAYDATGSDWAAPLPDGYTILVSHDIPEQSPILSLIQPNGSAIEIEHRIESIGACCAWSDDGSLFANFSFEPVYGIYLVDSNGQNRRLLVPGARLGEGRFLSGTFAPDNQMLAFEWVRPGQEYFEDTQIYLVNIDGSGLRQLTPNDSGSHRWLRWSPDGNFIAFFRRAKEGDESLWLTQVRPVASPLLTPLVLPPFNPPMAAAAPAQSVAEDGFIVTLTDSCPHQLHFSFTPEPVTSEQWAEIPFMINEEAMFWVEQQGLPLRRIQPQAVNRGINWSISDLTTSPPTLLTLHWIKEQVRWGGPATLMFDGVATELVGPVTIMGASQELTSPYGITCQAPQPVEIRGNPGWLLQQQAALGTLFPAVNTVIWQEDGVYWRISGLDRSTGGDYTGDTLLQMAQKQIQQYDAKLARWQTLR